MLNKQQQKDSEKCEQMQDMECLECSCNVCLAQAPDNEGKYLNALREIDTHIRSTKNPIPYIIQTLKDVLPEYKR